MGKVVEKKKRKKKGRPSLLDLQKRNLREQQEQQQQKLKRIISAPPSSDNYTPATASSLRRSTCRNAAAEAEEDGEESEGDSRREKKLKLVQKLPPQKSPDDSAKPSSDAEEDEDSASGHRKRKINAIRGGSGVDEDEKGDQSAPGADNDHENGLDLGPSTPLPDKKLLLFILDRLQKKDTYGVFAEPVDPEELPDYHEIINHPMDFQTIRKKLDAGLYANLEQFEKDVFLICSNAMQYNAPDTIYFRQARSIDELAKKNFENLKQDSDYDEPEPKVARRGRPPVKHIIRKMMQKSSLERTASDFSSATTLAENSAVNISSDKTRVSESSGRLQIPKNVLASLLPENKFERSEEGSMLKSNIPAKNGKRPFVVDENRRNTYKQINHMTLRREPSLLATFREHRKQLLPVGLHTEHGYARSLACFAAQLGPVAWRLASTRIEKCLPSGVKFGPGWVVENDLPPQRPRLLTPQCQSQPSASDNLCFSSSDKLSEMSDPNTEKRGTISGFDERNSNVGIVRPRPPVQTQPRMNGFNGAYRFNHFAQMVKSIMISNDFHLEKSKLSENSGAPSSTTQLPDSGSLQKRKQDSGLPQNPVPNSDTPDLTAKFQSPESRSSCQVDSTQPDLALQL